jgi:quercetin dioxygenase-like cupin family protein
MIIKNNADVFEKDVEEEEVVKVKQQILIGPEDGSQYIIMRRFRILSDGNTPYHTHPHEHVVKIEKGKGLIIDIAGNEIPINEGQSLLVAGGEKHQFKNPFDDPLEFVCIILNPERPK